MGIETKTLGMIIDELITTDLKCFMQQEIIISEKDNDKVATASRKAQELNGRRNLLIKAIDDLNGGSEFSHTSKTYVEDKK